MAQKAILGIETRPNKFDRATLCSESVSGGGYNKPSTGSGHGLAVGFFVVNLDFFNGPIVRC